MAKVLSALFPFLMVWSAFAQTSGAEPPAEKASGITVVIFLLLFVGSCVGYFVYLWWTKKRPQKDEGEEPR